MVKIDLCKRKKSVSLIAIIPQNDDQYLIQKNFIFIVLRRVIGSESFDFFHLKNNQMSKSGAK